MSETNIEPTGDDVPDGTQLPVKTEEDEPNQDQDAGVSDTGAESWYETGDDA